MLMAGFYGCIRHLYVAVDGHSLLLLMEWKVAVSVDGSYLWLLVEAVAVNGSCLLLLMTVVCGC